jgi:hypothetical protein
MATYEPLAKLRRGVIQEKGKIPWTDECPSCTLYVVADVKLLKTERAHILRVKAPKVTFDLKTKTLKVQTFSILKKRASAAPKKPA